MNPVEEEKREPETEQTGREGEESRDELDLAEAAGMLARPGACALFAGFALAGWFLSGPLGKIWLWLGVGAGVLAGGGLLLMGHFSASIAEKIVKKQKKTGMDFESVPEKKREGP